MNALTGKGRFEGPRFVEGENFACLMPLRRGRKPMLGALIRSVEAALAGTGAAVALDPLHTELMPPVRDRNGPDWLDPGAAFLIVNGVQVTVSWQGVDAPRPGWARDYANPRLWPGAEAELAACRASVLVTEMGIPGETGPAAAFDRAAAVTLVAEALWPLTAGIGLLWSPARTGLGPARLGDAFDTVRSGRAALTLWMGWREVPPASPHECPGLVTRGLLPFVGREIEAPPSRVPAPEMLQHVIHLAAGLVDHQAALEDGQHLATAGGTPLRVALVPEGRLSGAPAFVIGPAA